MVSHLKLEFLYLHFIPFNYLNQDEDHLISIWHFQKLFILERKVFLFILNYFHLKLYFLQHIFLLILILKHAFKPYHVLLMVHLDFLVNFNGPHVYLFKTQILFYHGYAY
mmetsp:Transcript_15973/g.1425  ORF Transcript_15973/g.1425 Transcript_15973/m.1425 type:complete len:110 (-) Transcript_15973:101-430(-)